MKAIFVYLTLLLLGVQAYGVHGQLSEPLNVKAEQYDPGSILVSWNQAAHVLTPSSSYYYKVAYWAASTGSSWTFYSNRIDSNKGDDAGNTYFTKWIGSFSPPETLTVQVVSYSDFPNQPVASGNITVVLDPSHEGPVLYVLPTSPMFVREDVGTFSVPVQVTRLLEPEVDLECYPFGSGGQTAGRRLLVERGYDPATPDEDYVDPVSTVRLTFTSVGTQYCNFTILQDQKPEDAESFLVIVDEVEVNSKALEVVILCSDKPTVDLITVSGYSVSNFAQAGGLFNLTTPIAYSDSTLTVTIRQPCEGATLALVESATGNTETLTTVQNSTATPFATQYGYHTLQFRGLAQTSATTTDRVDYTIGYTRPVPVWTVTSATPNTVSIHGGTLVTITGSGFTSADIWRAGSTQLVLSSFVSTTQVLVMSPTGTGSSVQVTVGSPDGLYSSSSSSSSSGGGGGAPTLTYATPSITGIAPTSLNVVSAAGSVLNVTGTNLGLASATPPVWPTVTLGDGGSACVVTYLSPPASGTQLQTLSCTLPSSTGGGRVVRVALGGRVSTENVIFTYSGFMNGLSVTIPPAGSTTSEDGQTQAVTVTLLHKPTSDVLVPIVVSDATEGRVSPSVFTFTSVTWNITQTAAIIGVDDYIADGPQTYAVTVGPGQSTDPNFASLPTDVYNTTVINTDNDVVGVRYAPITALTHAAGSDVRIGVTLGSQPNGTVSVLIRSTTSARVSISPDVVVFTPQNWNISRLVTFTYNIDGMPSPFLTNYEVELTASSSQDPSYLLISQPTLFQVAVVIAQGATDRFLIEQLQLNTTEGGAKASFFVSLMHETTTTTNLSIVCNRPSEAVPDQAIHILPANTASTGIVTQKFVVAGVNDFVQDGAQAFTISIYETVAATGVVNLVGTLNGLNFDDDISKLDMRVVRNTTEAGSPRGQLTVRLTATPSFPVTVTLRSLDTRVGTLTPTAQPTIVLASVNDTRTFDITGVRRSDTTADLTFQIEAIITATKDVNFALLKGLSLRSPVILVRDLVWPIVNPHLISPSVLPLAGGSVRIPVSQVSPPVTFTQDGQSLLVSVVPINRTTTTNLLQGSTTSSSPSPSFFDADIYVTLRNRTASGKGYSNLVLISQNGAFVDVSGDIVFSDDCPQSGTYGNGQTCVTCPTTATCPGGGRVWPQAGAWVPSEFPSNSTPVEVYECYPPERCAGGRNASCAEGYTGDFCGDCASGWYRLDEVCRRCSNAGVTIALSVINLLFIIMIITGIIFCTENALTNVMTVISFIQLLRAVSQMNKHRLPDGVQVFFNLLSLTTGDFQFMRPDCEDAVIPSSDFLALFWTTVIMEVVYRGLLVALIPLHAVAHHLYLRRIMERHAEKEAEIAHRARVAEELSLKLKNAPKMSESFREHAGRIRKQLADMEAEKGEQKKSTSHTTTNSTGAVSSGTSHMTSSGQRVTLPPIAPSPAPSPAPSAYSSQRPAPHMRTPSDREIPTFERMDTGVSVIDINDAQQRRILSSSRRGVDPQGGGGGGGGGFSAGHSDSDSESWQDDGGSDLDNADDTVVSRRRPLSSSHGLINPLTGQASPRSQPQPAQGPELPTLTSSKLSVSTSSNLDNSYPQVDSLVLPPDYDALGASLTTSKTNVASSRRSSSRRKSRPSSSRGHSRGASGRQVGWEDRKQKQRVRQELWNVCMSRFIRGNLIIAVFSFFNLTTKCFQAIHCITTFGRRHLSHEMTVECYSTEHYPAAVVAWCILVLYCIIMPQGLGLYFYFHRHDLGQDTIQSKWGYLYEKYRLQHYWFGLLTLNSLTLIAFATSVLARDALAQFLVIEFVYVSLFVLYATLKPFRAPWKNRTAFFVLLAVIVGAFLNFFSTEEILSTAGFSLVAVLVTIVYLFVLAGYMLKWLVVWIRDHRKDVKVEQQLGMAQAAIARQAAKRLKESFQLRKQFEVAATAHDDDDHDDDVVSHMSRATPSPLPPIADVSASPFLSHGAPGTTPQSQTGPRPLGWERKPPRVFYNGDGQPVMLTREDTVVKKMRFEKTSDPKVFEPLAPLPGEHPPVVHRDVSHIKRAEDGRPVTPTREDEAIGATSFAVDGRMMQTRAAQPGVKERVLKKNIPIPQPLLGRHGYEGHEHGDGPPGPPLPARYTSSQDMRRAMTPPARAPHHVPGVVFGLASATPPPLVPTGHASVSVGVHRAPPAPPPLPTQHGTQHGRRGSAPPAQLPPLAVNSDHVHSAVTGQQLQPPSSQQISTRGRSRLAGPGAGEQAYTPSRSPSRSPLPQGLRAAPPPKAHMPLESKNATAGRRAPRQVAKKVPKKAPRQLQR